MLNLPKEQLVNLYYEEKLTLEDIANLYDCGIVSVYRYFNKYSISRRTNSEARRLEKTKHIHISEHFQNILDGLLLGDGCLMCPDGFQAFYTQGSSQKQFIACVSQLFKEYGYFQHSGYTKADLANNRKPHDLFYFTSPRTMELKGQYNRWYPDGTKHAPEDIKLTPNTILFWYLGDGSKKLRRKEAYLATCAYTRNEQEILVTAFSKIGIHATIVKYTKYYLLRISKKDNFDKFMQYMGPNPVSCYAYKFDIVK